MSETLDYEDLAAELSELGTGVIVTPGQISDYRRTILSSAAILNGDFQRTEIDDPFILEAWNSWYDDLLDYESESGFWGDLWEGAMTMAERKAQELSDWREIYADSAGRAATGPGVIVTKAPSIDVDKIATAAKWVAIPVVAYFLWDAFGKRR